MLAIQMMRRPFGLHSSPVALFTVSLKAMGKELELSITCLFCRRTSTNAHGAQG
jgi:hypothetical protein